MSKELVRIGEPVTDMGQAVELAKILASSPMMPDALRGNPASVFTVIAWGAELGISPLQAVASIGVIGGRPVMSGQLLLAKARKAGHRVDILHSDGRKAVVKLTRKDDGSTTEMSFSLQDALRAGLTQVDANGNAYARAKSGKVLPWETYTVDLLLWRAVSRVVRFGCPEVMMAQFLTEEEADSIKVEQIEEPETATVDIPVATVVNDASVEDELKSIEAAKTPAQDSFLLDDEEQPESDSDAYDTYDTYLAEQEKG